MMNEQYATRVKYPRTPHFSWTESAAADDRISDDVGCLFGNRIIVTEKMDGENTTMTRDYTHARSVDSRHHESRAWVKNFWAGIRHDIPDGWRICGENMYAQHTIPYKNLPSYFLGFSMWNDENKCLNWDETMQWFNVLGIESAQILYDGIYDEKELRRLARPEILLESEGYVARPAMAFHFLNFSSAVRKYVRRNHVQTDEHWMFRQLIPNKLQGK